MVSSKHTRSTRNRVTKAGPRPQVTTIRLDQAVQEGLRMLEVHSGVKRPLNKWVNMALADFIERRAATIENQLDEALRSIRTYRKTDPSFKRAIKAFIDAEVSGAAADPMEGSPEPRAIGPAVSIVRKMLHG